MKCTNPEKLFEQFPQLKDIAARLEKSELEANEKAKIKKQTEQPAEQEESEGTRKKKEHVPPYAEHFLITRYRKNGVWKNTVYSSASGRKAFETAVDICLNNYDPDAITVKLFPRSTERDTGKSKKTQEVDVYFSQEEEMKPDKNPMQEELKEKIEQFERKLETLGTASPNSAMQELQLLKKDSDHALEKFKLTQDYERKIDGLQRENTDLQFDLDDANEYIEDLEGERENYEKTLGSVHDEYEKKEKKKEESPLVTMLSAVGENALKGFVVKNPELLDGFNFSKEQKEKFLSKLNNSGKIEAGKEETKTTGASASDPVSGIDADLKDKSEPHAKALKNYWLWLKGLSLDDFKVLYEINMAFATAEGGFDKEVANPILEQIRAAKKEPETAQP